jgi:hypothetical protein
MRSKEITERMLLYPPFLHFTLEYIFRKRLNPILIINPTYVMNKFLFLCIIAVVSFFVWDKYLRNPEPIVVSPVTSTNTAVASEQYGQSLSVLADKLLSPIDGTVPLSKTELSRLSGVAQADFQRGYISAREADIIIKLCNYLDSLYTEREKYSVGYRDVQNKNFISFQGTTKANDKKKFFLNDYQRNWESFINQHRSSLFNRLEELRRIERDREIDSNVKAPTHVSLTEKGWH